MGRKRWEKIARNRMIEADQVSNAKVRDELISMGAYLDKINVAAAAAATPEEAEAIKKRMLEEFKQDEV